MRSAKQTKQRIFCPEQQYDNKDRDQYGGKGTTAMFDPGQLKSKFSVCFSFACVRMTVFFLRGWWNAFVFFLRHRFLIIHKFKIYLHSSLSKSKFSQASFKIKG